MKIKIQMNVFNKAIIFLSIYSTEYIFIEMYILKNTYCGNFIIYKNQRKGRFFQ